MPTLGLPTIEYENTGLIVDFLQKEVVTVVPKILSLDAKGVNRIGNG